MVKENTYDKISTETDKQPKPHQQTPPVTLAREERMDPPSLLFRFFLQLIFEY
jgi:hypothetical protein